MTQPGQVAALTRHTLLAALIGIPTGLVAFGFIALVHGLEDGLWHGLPTALGLSSAPWWLLVGLPALAGALVFLARQLPGSGGPSPLHTGLSGATPMRDVPSVLLASLASLSLGLVLGPEAPLMALGGALAVWLTTQATLDDNGRGLLAVSGVASALSTLFGGPLVAGLMVLEAGALAGLPIVPLMLTSLTSASVGYLLITGLGQWTGLPVTGLNVSDLPFYDVVAPVDLLVAVGVGLAMGVAGVAIRVLAVWIARVQGQRLLLGLIAGGAAVGALAWLAGLFGADPMDVLFSGQTSITPLLAASWPVALVLFAAKGLAYTISLAGFRGGAIFPAVFLGVAVASLAVAALGMSPTVAVAIGAAAGMAAVSRMLLSPILFAGLLVGPAGIEALPVAGLAGVVAWLVAAGLDSRLAAHGVHLEPPSDQASGQSSTESRAEH